MQGIWESCSPDDRVHGQPTLLPIAATKISPATRPRLLHTHARQHVPLNHRLVTSFRSRTPSNKPASIGSPRAACWAGARRIGNDHVIVANLSTCLAPRNLFRTHPFEILPYAVLRRRHTRPHDLFLSLLRCCRRTTHDDGGLVALGEGVLGVSSAFRTRGGEKP